jgi:uncharacterized membrane protein
VSEEATPVTTTDDLAELARTTIVVLTWGFRIGALMLTLGLVLALLTREPLHTVADPFDEVLPAVVMGRAAGMVDLAILWLMATPVMAVLMVAIGFFRLRDLRYTIVSLLVLAVLGVSIGLALGR